MRPGPSTPLVQWAKATLQEMRDNKRQIVVHDEMWTRMEGQNKGRKEMLDHAYEREERDGSISRNTEAQLATNKCVACGKREVKLLQCSKCKEVFYCDATCQVRASFAR